MKTEEKYKLKNEWELDYSELNSKLQYELLKHFEGKKVNNELLKEALNIINIQKENYYTEKEKERKNKIKKGVLTDKIINNQEACSKKHLAEKFLRYGYNLEYLKSYLHLINLGYLVRVKEFIQMKDGGYLEKELSDIIIYKDIIQDFLNVIDKSIIDEYKKTNYAPEKQLYPLTMNEYMTPKKK
ncbi:hypothetical protein BTO04_02135 [Polaribacter sp. SA4-10]|jgi:hypothetical protein|uniref:hypothetical protein n=1 Tax=Polaribacter sp. SA4-10 TaxID=754397 RepID=UPI000B3D49AB|nr:hypothetical protein [Polaribacter sp. SA4-10]ARV05568.1 hypothetical protein BTO04_02135 [Polaribacter sp. SA4-10]